MALRTLLSAAEVADLVRAFGLPPPERVEPEPRGAVNTNHHVWAGGARWFLRLSEGAGESEVRLEAALLERLRAAGLPVPRLRPAVDGRPCALARGRPAVLFEWLPGEESGRAAAGPDRCRAVGALLGRLHALAPTLLPARPNPFGPAVVAGWVAALERAPLPGAGGEEIRAALPVLREEAAAAAALPAAPRALVHGDLFLENVLWRGHAISGALDWEMACEEVAAYDLAVALCAWCWTDRFEPARARALVEGYRAAHPLDPATAAALHPWACFAALRFTVSRIHGFALSGLPPERLAWKDWRRYRGRLLALRELGDGGLRALAGA
jgi:homoserine kinase type II